MAVTAFSLGGHLYKKRQSTSGSFGVGRDWGGSCTVTAEHSGLCNFSSFGDVGYFAVTLYKNGERLASGNMYNKTSNNYGFDMFWAGQYARGACSLMFRVKKGDVIKFECGQNNDGGNGTVYWNMVVYD